MPLPNLLPPVKEPITDQRGFATRAFTLFLEQLIRRILPTLSNNPGDVLNGNGQFTPGVLTSIVDAKGDLLVGTAPDTLARLPVGSNGQVLTADSAQTTGVKWATTITTLYLPLVTGGEPIQLVSDGDGGLVLVPYIP